MRGLGFTDYMLHDLDDRARRRALDALRATIVAHDDTGQGVLYPSATRVITAHRS
ncbi:hypothetical protein [Pseudonocardia sp. H11422]|uniref:hypothetical protein n=1 Tax=Pseudonocardia sp. H11422 TaxID=2835866 RepID=UPI001BDC9DFD|nr:hypothetical protein [Pseudonocardia sp. H11422]